jgi:hypothetical protein
MAFFMTMLESFYHSLNGILKHSDIVLADILKALIALFRQHTLTFMRHLVTFFRSIHFNRNYELVRNVRTSLKTSKTFRKTRNIVRVGAKTVGRTLI